MRFGKYLISFVGIDTIASMSEVTLDRFRPVYMAPVNLFRCAHFTCMVLHTPDIYACRSCSPFVFNGFVTRRFLDKRSAATRCSAAWPTSEGVPEPLTYTLLLRAYADPYTRSYPLQLREILPDLLTDVLISHASSPPSCLHGTVLSSHRKIGVAPEARVPLRHYGLRERRR